ncbi:hypothetical protein [Catellatospora chokoriensis]|uniref:Uncharacterized protein n=1 Tax=Catellatospora chokoriensis TaxID=310353 RepID=A0A8J3K7Y6_9ACTN|nr:hypothetical protein [Catellatospora chokoriensis]GIF94537.1 hypothetical protein Cch02nite_79810 [Catellatospora chokoriensis]
MTQQLFQEVIGEKPPSTIDVKQVVRRERRRARLRRLVGAAGVVTLASITVAGLSLQPPAGQDGPPVARPAPTTSAEAGFRLVYNTEESARTTAERLTAELLAAVQRSAPQATWLTGPAVRYTEKSPDDEGILFRGGGNMSLDGRRSALGIWVMPAGRTMPACVDFATTCQKVTAANGVRMVLGTWRDGGPVAAYTMEITLADGRQFYVQHTTKLGSAKSGAAAKAPVSSAVALSRDQVVAIAAEIAAKVIA